jgi:hypothetical protein
MTLGYGRLLEVAPTVSTGSGRAFVDAVSGTGQPVRPPWRA